MPASLAMQAAAQVDERLNPFPGLRPFEPDEDYLFFGREQQTDEAILKKLLEDHHRWTGSQRARDILDHWAEARAKFVKVFPNEYRRALGELNAAKEAAQTIAQAKAPAAVKV